MHEQSETVQRDGKWFNVYGRATSTAGQVLPGEPAYSTVDEAVAGARRRSEASPEPGRGLAGIDADLGRGARARTGLAAIDADLMAPEMTHAGSVVPKGIPQRMELSEVASRALGRLKDFPARAGSLIAGTREPEGLTERAIQTYASALPIMKAGQLVKAAPAVARAVTSGAMEGGRAYAKDEPVIPAALLGAGVAGLTEAAGSALSGVATKYAKPVADRLASMVSRGGAEVSQAARAAEADRIAQEIGNVLPSLKVKNAGELYDMAKTWGRKAIETDFGREAASIVSKVAAPGVAAIKIKIPALDEGALSAKDAIAKLLAAEDDVRRAARPQLVAALNRLDPKSALGDALEAALKLRASGYAYVNAIEKSLDTHGALDVSKLAALVNKARIPDAVRNVLTGGQPVPVAVPPSVKTPRLAPGPSSFARAASGVADAAESNALRSVADAVTTNEAPTVAGGVMSAPMGLLHRAARMVMP